MRVVIIVVVMLVIDFVLYILRCEWRGVFVSFFLLGLIKVLGIMVRRISLMDFRGSLLVFVIILWLSLWMIIIIMRLISLY